MAEQACYIPDFFEPLVREQYGDENAARILDGCAGKRAVTLRANALLATRDEVAAALDAAGIAWQPVSWYDDAFILPCAREKDVWELDVYRDGHVYLQSLSSMIPALALGARNGDDVCDMCAAPGGKTTQIAALARGAYVTACEMHAPRADKLEHNLEKLGARNVTVMRTDARRLDEFFSFDRILVDAPCSGSGTLRADDPRVAKRFTQALVDKSVKSQRALLSKGLSLLRPGGTLVYSTCSILGRENEAVLEWALKRAGRAKQFELKPIELAASDDLPTLPTQLEGTLALCPTTLYEGFFVAKVVRVI